MHSAHAQVRSSDDVYDEISRAFRFGEGGPDVGYQHPTMHQQKGKWMRRPLHNALAALGGGILVIGGALAYVSSTAAAPTASRQGIDARLSNFETQSGGEILSGARLPTDRLGATGDFYFRTGTDQLFGPKTTRVAHPWGAVGIHLAGSRGPAGPAGQKGAAGPAGPQGPKGTAGTSILSGKTPPTTQGITGDFYLDTSTEMLYGPKATGKWPTTGTSLIGNSGTSGASATQTVVVKRATFPVASAATATGDAACASGYVVTGGGYTSTLGTVRAQNDAPVLSGTTWEWEASVANTTTTKKATVTVYAICTKGTGHVT
jgi:hypothetical protein